MFSTILDLPHLDVRWVKNILIPMRDGISLAADLCLPSERLMAQNGWDRLPVVLEYIPYRKDEAAPGARFSETLARCGYIVARVDLRGTGDSGGVSTDEYLPVEQQDGFDTVEWLARQPWCDSQVAMMGISYGGFTALQVAALQPPHLRTVIPVDFTDDRYSDDCHYCGGLLRMYYDVAFYASMMVAYNALPPFPEWAGEGWEQTWQDHLEGNSPYLLAWLAQQTDGSYWRNGSVRFAAEKIKIPVFLIGGWRDGYPNPPLRLYQALRSPRKVLIGPWNHAWPDKAVPGPRIDFVHEAARWLDYWCKGRETGVMTEPPVQVFMQEYQPPVVDRLETAGEWRAELDFPPPGTVEVPLFLAHASGLAEEIGPTGAVPYRYDPTVGLDGGLWSGGIMFGLPGDQRRDDAASLTFTSTPLSADLAILGRPQVTLYVSTTAAVLGFVARLCEVAPDGTSTLVTKGALNATRRSSLSDPEPLAPGQVYQLDFALDCTGWVFRAGRRIRLAVANADFPNLWPTPEPAVSQVYFGEAWASQVRLPSVPLAGSAAPAVYRPSRRQVIPHSEQPEPPIWQARRDLLTGAVTVALGVDSEFRVPGRGDDSDVHIHHHGESEFRVAPDHPEASRALGCFHASMARPGFEVCSQARVSITAARETFDVEIELQVDWNSHPHAHRHWSRTFPRHLL